MSGYDRASGPYREADPEVVEIDTVAVVAPGDEAADDTRELQDRIEDTRADMGETIDAIQERLSPRRIGEQVREQVRGATIGRAEQMVSDATDTAREAGGGLVDLLRDNPVPAALAALGLGWLWLKRPGGQGGGGGRRAPAGGYGGYRGGYGAYDRGDGYRGAGYPAGGYRAGGYRDDDDDGGPGDAVRRAGRRAQGAAGQAAGAVQDAAGQAADRVQDAAGQAAGAVQQAAGQVQDTAQQLGGQVRYGARRARSGLEGSLQESPLAAGAIALAVGVAVGLAAPSTDVEDRLMGEARDSVVQKAQDTAQDTLGKVQHVAERTADATKETAQQEARNQGLTGTKG
jgi:uncharacterized protein YjbJ (UPF0337 family)